MSNHPKIEPRISSFCPGNAYWMARIAQAAYFHKNDKARTPDTQKIKQSLKKDDNSFLSVEGFSANSAQAVIVEHEKYICMAFRGTDETADWLDNLDCRRVSDMFGEFHSGFHKSVTDVWNNMNEHYQELRENQQRHKKEPRLLFITGHSLGGAMATIAAAKLITEDRPFASVYTFGQPRAMNRKAARIFNAECKGRFFRFHNNNDLVTRIPARIMGFGHVGEHIYISQEKTILQDPSNWLVFLDAIDGAIEKIGKIGLDCIEDHDMENYMNAIEKWKIEKSSPSPVPHIPDTSGR